MLQNGRIKTCRLHRIELHNQTANDVNEQVIKGNIAIIKHTDDGETQIETPEEGAVFEVYEPMRGNLKIVKTSSDGKVEGFAFRITGANGYDVTLETDEKGEIFIEGLRIGEYKISEVNNSASAMYILPADKEAAVQTGSTTVVEMHNELRDTPKTGDDSKLGLWLALAGVSVAGIAACGIFGFKKKKKKEDN